MDISLEPLQEVATIAAGNAATALSKLIGHDITVTVPSVKLVAAEKVISEIGDVTHLSSTTLVRIKGDLQGFLLFDFDPHVAQAVATGINDRQAGGTYKDQGEVILHEMVNIVSGAALSAMSKFLNLNILQSVPDSATDMLGAILDPLIAELSSEFKTMLILQELFALPVNGANLKCIAIIDPPSTARMLEKMTEKLGPADAAANN